MKLNTERYILPSDWASYLINDDHSSLTEDEIQEIDALIKKEKIYYFIDCSEDQYFSHNWGRNVSEYVAHVRPE